VVDRLGGGASKQQEQKSPESHGLYIRYNTMDIVLFIRRGRNKKIVLLSRAASGIFVWQYDMAAQLHLRARISPNPRGLSVGFREIRIRSVMNSEAAVKK